MKRDIITEIICFLFIVLFVYAALVKLADVQKFSVQMGQSPMLMAFTPILVWVVPITELIVAAMLIFKRSRLVGLYAAFTLMVMFTMYIVIILNFAEHVPCSCGGILEKMGWKEHLAFNVAFVLLSVVGVALVEKPGGQPANSSTKIQYAS